MIASSRATLSRNTRDLAVAAHLHKAARHLEPTWCFARVVWLNDTRNFIVPARGTQNLHFWGL